MDGDHAVGLKHVGEFLSHEFDALQEGFGHVLTFDCGQRPLKVVVDGQEIAQSLHLGVFIELDPLARLALAHVLHIGGTTQQLVFQRRDFGSGIGFCDGV
ncbi:MAG: hypothetical protein RL177_846 [Bacteroidota bacterium]